MTGGMGSAAIVAVVAIVPLILLMLTSFVKISVVLSLLRNALGAPEAPSGLVVMGLSLILTFFVMAPIAIEMAQAASKTASSPPTPRVRGAGSGGAAAAEAAAVGETAVGGTAVGGTAVGGTAVGGTAVGGTAVGAAAVGGTAVGGTAVGAAAVGGTAVGGTAVGGTAAGGTAVGGTAVGGTGDGKVIDVDAAIRELVPAQYRPQVDAVARALGPLRGFLLRHASARDRETFTELARRMGRVVEGEELWVLAPAFVTTELREAFAIAVLIFVPFLVIDLIVGLGLAALGLASTSPQAIALPLKLLLFVAVDGWRLLIDGLLRGYV